MFCHNDPFSFWLWNHQDTLRDDELFFEKFLREGDTIIDAGANIGLLTLRAAKIVKSSGRVISIEPHPETFKWLTKNIHLNSYTNVELHNCAVGNVDGVVNFTNFRIKDINKVSDTEGVLRLPITTIDNLTRDVSACTILKLDVEGLELPAMIGAEKMLQKTDVLMFESSPRNFLLQNYTLQDIFSYLESKGFYVYKIRQDFVIEKIEKDYQTMVKYENLFATRNVEFLQQRLDSTNGIIEI